MDEPLTIDALLTTTRSVRKRLDCTKPVPRHLIEDCIAAAQQAPSGGNLQTWGFVVVTDYARHLELHAGRPCPWSGHLWTIFHLYFEEEAAQLLGIPHAEVTQVALLPVAYTQGTAFKPGPRNPFETMIHWDAW